MNKSAARLSPATHVSPARFAVVRSCAFVVTIFSLLLIPAGFCAEQPDDQYVRVRELVQQADALNAKGKNAEAKAKYEEAQRALLDFKRANPSWNPRIVSYRIGYVAEKISALTQPVLPPQTNDVWVPSEPKSARPPGAALPAGAQVKLLEPGAEPRKPLRLHPKGADQQMLNLFIDPEQDAKQKDASKMPGIRMSFTIRSQNPAANGDIDYEAVMNDIGLVSEAGVSPQMLEGIKTAFASLKGFQINGTVSDRGQNKKSQIKLPPKADPFAQMVLGELQDSFTGQCVFPEEAIGPGARWEVKEKVKSEGATIDQTSTLQLVSVEGDVVVVNTSGVASAANQKFSNPMMGGNVTLIKMTGKSKATMTVDTTKIAPLKATVDVHEERTMTVNGGQVNSSSDAKFRMESK